MQHKVMHCDTMKRDLFGMLLKLLQKKQHMMQLYDKLQILEATF